jgi:hypothetical protein
MSAANVSEQGRGAKAVASRRRVSGPLPADIPSEGVRL